MQANLKITNAGRGTRQRRLLPRPSPATLARTITAFMALSAGTTFAAPPSATPYKVLFYFYGSSNGLLPSSSLVADKAGNLYGTTPDGAAGYGVVYKVALNGHETTLYSFTGGADGAVPVSNLAIDESGNLYGTTFQGGASGNGTVFKLTPKGTETVLYSFKGGKDGSGATGNVLRDKSGRLWGLTFNGGAADEGTVFTVSPSGKERVIFAFSGADGNTPTGIARDAQGNIYGTTVRGGTGNVGTVFKIAPDGTESVIYSFQNGFDGGEPGSGVALDRAGNLYGTTLGGGATYNGVVFKVTPAGAETVLYAFTGGSDGGTPYGILVQDSQGNFYGTTANGGSPNFGVVYKLAADGTETVLHRFSSGPDGDTPRAGLVFNPAAGKKYFFGTTTGAGEMGHGTVFQIRR